MKRSTRQSHRQTGLKQVAKVVGLAVVIVVAMVIVVAIVMVRR